MDEAAGFGITLNPNTFDCGRSFDVARHRFLSFFCVFQVRIGFKK
jgi:hypothetical protein